MIDGLCSDVDLSHLNTLAIPSRARFYFKCLSKNDLQLAIFWAQQHSHPLFILGGGSNVLLDEYIDGLVVQPAMNGKTIVQKNNRQHVLAMAGENWHDFVQWCVEQQWFGLENLALIPGLVGAAPIQNIGAYGVEVAEWIHAVHCIDIRDGSEKVFSQEACAFSYRDSVFKQAMGKFYVVVAVEFALSKVFEPRLTYPALNNYFTNQVAKNSASCTAQSVLDAVVAIRREKLPLPENLPNAGSFFKNPVLDVPAFMKIQAQYPQIVSFDTTEGKKKIAAAWLIDQAGWKERALDGVHVHHRQALVLVNPKRKTLGAVMALAKAIQLDVESRFGIRLEIEPQRLRPLYVG